MHGVFFEIHEPGHAKKHCSFTLASAGIIGYRSINCTAVLNPFAFVTVLVLTISEQYEYSDPLKDQTRPVAIRLKTAKSGRRLFFVSKNILIKLRLASP